MLEMIVAMTKERLIGDANPEGNGLLWHCSEDLKFFKEKTENKILIVGENTSKFMPLNKITKTGNRSVEIFQGNMLDLKSWKDYIICGGAYTYEFFLLNKIIDRIYINVLKDNVEIEESENPLYFPFEHIEYYYDLVKRTEHKEFVSYEYVPKEF